MFYLCGTGRLYVNPAALAQVLHASYIHNFTRRTRNSICQLVFHVFRGILGDIKLCRRAVRDCLKNFFKSDFQKFFFKLQAPRPPLHTFSAKHTLLYQTYPLYVKFFLYFF